MSLLLEVDNFQGSAEDLLHLVKRNKVEPSSVSMADLTGQFLNWLEEEELDLEAATRFMVAVSLLMLIKARNLLPAHGVYNLAVEHQEKEEPSGPDLAPVPASYAALSLATRRMREQEELAAAIFFRPAGIQLPGDNPVLPVKNYPLDGLLNALQSLLNKRGEMPREITAPSFDVEKVAEAVLRRMVSAQGPLFLEDLLEDGGPAEIVAIILAILELVRGGEVKMEQAKSFGPVVITACNSRCAEVNHG